MENYKWTKQYIDNRITELANECVKLNATVSELYTLRSAIETHEAYNEEKGK